jgi:hypothetical protein
MEAARHSKTVMPDTDLKYVQSKKKLMYCRCFNAYFVGRDTAELLSHDLNAGILQRISGTNV